MDHVIHHDCHDGEVRALTFVEHTRVRLALGVTYAADASHGIGVR